jgi:hypothetical protein
MASHAKAYLPLVDIIATSLIFMNIHEYQTLLFKNDKFLFTVYEKGFF